MHRKEETYYIDAHAHLWSEEYLEKLEELGSPDTDVARNIGAGTSKKEIEKRIQMMDKAGVKYQILSATPQSPQWGSAVEAHKLSQEINNLYADIQKAYPERFVSEQFLFLL